MDRVFFRTRVYRFSFLSETRRLVFFLQSLHVSRTMHLSENWCSSSLLYRAAFFFFHSTPHSLQKKNIRMHVMLMTRKRKNIRIHLSLYSKIYRYIRLTFLLEKFAFFIYIEKNEKEQRIKVYKINFI